jgi:hypothetical protein
MSQDKLLVYGNSKNKTPISEDNSASETVSLLPPSQTNQLYFINSDVKHLEQETMNDCGVAVARMALL